MKIVYSHWSRQPLTADKRIILALSVLLARRHYQQIEMVTDDAGASLFRKMGLEFSKVSLSMNDFRADKEAWAAGKIHAYALQEEPFVHIDHDVFLFEPLPEWWTSAPVGAQDDEPRYRYDESLTKVHPPHRNLVALPDYNWHAYNTGIFGGHDLDFIRGYANEALKLIHDHPCFHWWAMPVYEQAFLSKYAHDRKREVTLLLKDHDEAEDLGYCHLMECKNRPNCVSRVYMRLQSEDRDLYRRAILAGD